MASEAEEILAIDTKEDIEDDENIIEIPIDEPPDAPEPIKTREFQCDVCFKVLSSKNNLKEIDSFVKRRNIGRKNNRKYRLIRIRSDELSF